MNDLPIDLFRSICLYLEEDDLFHVKKSCKHARKTINVSFLSELQIRCICSTCFIHSQVCKLNDRYLLDFDGKSFKNLLKLNCDGSNIAILQLFPKVRDLSCFNNELTSLSDSIHLIKLRCSHNQLTILPNFHNLTELDCCFNQLTSIPEMPHLQKLNCQYNQLTTLPCFPNLTDLCCSDNDIMELPSLPKIKRLRCWGNRLTAIPPFETLEFVCCDSGVIIPPISTLTFVHLFFTSI